MPKAVRERYNLVTETALAIWMRGQRPHAVSALQQQSGHIFPRIAKRACDHDCVWQRTYSTPCPGLFSFRRGVSTAVPGPATGVRRLRTIVLCVQTRGDGCCESAHPSIFSNTLPATSCFD